mmetsp:Transcript_108140/g.300678  ORF Transcript_108140/g.300678 Transcript_108140/m.300678 type:complete len:217 (-) Transcript_108140:8-658(-)
MHDERRDLVVPISGVAVGREDVYLRDRRLVRGLQLRRAARQEATVARSHRGAPGRADLRALGHAVAQDMARAAGPARLRPGVPPEQHLQQPPREVPRRAGELPRASEPDVDLRPRAAALCGGLPPARLLLGPARAAGAPVDAHVQGAPERHGESEGVSSSPGSILRRRRSEALRGRRGRRASVGRVRGDEADTVVDLLRDGRARVCARERRCRRRR